MLLFSLLCSLLLACSTTKPTEVSFDEAEVEALFYGFSKGVSSRELTPEEAFRARGACPRVTRARFTPGVDELGTLQVWGQGLERVNILAALSGGLAGEAPPHLEEDGSLRFAVGCRSCELILGQVVEGVPVGCRGPGHSMQLTRGRLTTEAAPAAPSSP